MTSSDDNEGREDICNLFTYEAAPCVMYSETKLIKLKLASVPTQGGTLWLPQKPEPVQEIEQQVQCSSKQNPGLGWKVSLTLTYLLWIQAADFYLNITV